MGKSSPKPPDPKETSAASTSTNVGTAIANAMMGNVNQVTPDGSLTTQQTGTFKWNDPYTGKTYDIPTFTSTQTLSDQGQKIHDANNQAQLNLANLATSQSSRLQGLLGTPFSLDGAPTGGDASALKGPQYTQYGSAPSLMTSFGDAGNITNSIAGAGPIQSTFGDAGAINKDYRTTIDNAGDITKTYGANDFSADRTKVEEALMARMQPYLDKDRESLETSLANRGVRLGSSGYGSAKDDFGRQVNDARLANIVAAGQEQSRMVGMDRDRATFQNAAQGQQYSQNANDAAFANQGIQLGNAAQQQQYGQLMGRAQFSNDAQAQQYGQNANNAAFANSAQAQRYGQLLGRAQFGNDATQQNFANNFQVTGANNSLADQSFNADIAKMNAQNQQRQQYLSEQYALRNQPINEISALMSGSQVTQPNFVNTNMPSIPTTDVGGLINQNYQNQLAAYQQKQAGWGGLLGGVGSILGALPLSDERVKEDIKPAGRLMGHNIYEFRYKPGVDDGRKHVGVMAQEVEKTRPDAVAKGPDGLRRVNYGLLFGQKKAA